MRVDDAEHARDDVRFEAWEAGAKTPRLCCPCCPANAWCAWPGVWFGRKHLVSWEVVHSRNLTWISPS